MEAPSAPSSRDVPALTPRAGARRVERHQGASLTGGALWIAFTIYLLVSGTTMLHHELSSDEVHSWNIVKGSATYPDLIHNSRYEGHPPGWYTLLWPLSRLTHDAASIQVLHWAIASLVAFLIIFCSPLRLLVRILVPFGYFFLFEYAILSRNYAIGILLGCGICFLLGRNDRDRQGSFLYYVLLFCMSNTHLLAAVLGGSLHLYVLLRMRQRNRTPGALVVHALLGVLVLLPSVYFIVPPADSALNIASWRDKWSAQHVSAFAQAPLRAFLPVPAWWDYHFWNTQALLEAISAAHGRKRRSGRRRCRAHRQQAFARYTVDPKGYE